jgi:uncharacterized protein
MMSMDAIIIHVQALGDTPSPPGLWSRMRSTRRRRVLLRVVFYGAALFLALPIAFCSVMTSVPRQDIAAPAAGYEEIRIESEGLKLRGWLARTDGPRPAVLIVHGFGDNLESYQDIGNLFRRRGHSVLLVDLRAHGGSEGRRTTLGDHEREDVRRAMDRLRHDGLAASGIVVLGYSLGAVASLLACVDQPDVRAILVESPFDTLRETIAHHGELLYQLPRWLPIGPIAIAFAEIHAGFDADRVDAVAAARALRAPLLAVAGGDDVRMPERVVRRIYDAHRGPKRLWVVPRATHVAAMLHPDYDLTIVTFLEEQGL